MKRLLNFASAVLVILLLISPNAVQALNIYKILEEPFYDPNSVAVATCSDNGTAPSVSGSGEVYMVGDSLTVGMDKQGNITQKLSTAGYQTTKIEATTGISVSSAIGKVRSDSDSVKAAKIVVVELGTNPGPNTTADSFSSDIQQMISTIKGINPSADIYWMNAYADNDHSAYAGVNQAIQSQSTNLNFHVIDWHTEALTDNTKYAPFSGVPGPPLVHPTSHYPELADFVVSALGSPNNASGSTGCCSTQLSGSDNKQAVWNYFKGKGLSDAQVAGIMGNMEQESNFVPTVMQIGGNSQNPYDALGKGWGIIQWTGDDQTTPGDRTTGDRVMNNYKESGVSGNVYDLATQLDMVWQVMNNHPVLTQTFSLSDFKQITDANTATKYFLDHIEAGSDPAAPDGSGGIREFYARQILKDLGGTSGLGSSTGGCVFTSSTDCASVTGDPKILCEARKYEGIYYRWGGGHQGYTAFIAGCPDPSNPPNNQPHGSPPDPTDGGLSGNPSTCATDCSGLVSIAVDSAFNQDYNWSVSGGRMVNDGAEFWQPISISDAKAGDIVTKSEHVEIVVSVSGNSITTFGSHETGTKTGQVNSSTTDWSGAYRWTGPGSK